MKKKVEQLLKIINEERSCRTCPFDEICEDRDEEICVYLDKLNDKLASEEE